MSAGCGLLVVGVNFDTYTGNGGSLEILSMWSVMVHCDSQLSRIQRHHRRKPLDMAVI